MTRKYLDFYLELLSIDYPYEYKNEMMDLYNSVQKTCATLSDFELYGIIMAWMNDLYEFKFHIGPNFSVAVGLLIKDESKDQAVQLFKEAAIRDYILSAGRLTNVVDRIISLQNNEFTNPT